MYKNPLAEKFEVSKANEEEKMRLVGALIDKIKPVKLIDEDELVKENIPLKIEYRDFYEAPSLYGKIYSIDDIKSLYSSIFGDISKFNTDVVIHATPWDDVYIYYPKLNGYLKYQGNGKGGYHVDPPFYTSELTNAYKYDNKIELIETVYEITSVKYITKEDGMFDAVYSDPVEKYKFKYIFVEKDDIYSFASREKIL